MRATFHVVCHDCPEEGVYAERSEALAVRDTHSEGTGHRISLGDIAERNP